jgi:hypothetical protein
MITSKLQTTMEAEIVYFGQSIFCTAAEKLLLFEKAGELGAADI